MTRIAVARTVTLHSRQASMPAASASFDSTAYLAERQGGQRVDFATGKQSHDGPVCEVPLQVRRGVVDRSDALLALATRLRRLSSLLHIPSATLEESPLAASPPPSGAACVLDLQRLAAALDEHIRKGRRQEVALLNLQRELQRTRLELLESQVHAKRTRHAAYHDALTGLPNRISFEERSRRALTLHAPHEREFGLMYIDLDGFKSINDTHGHGVGDEILKIVGSRLTRTVRAEDSISRHGGDEFVCLLADVQSEEQVASIARKLFDAISAPCQLGPLALRVSPSIGVALYPRDGNTVEGLLECADSAMFWAKKHKHGHAFFGELPGRQQSTSSQSVVRPVACVV